MLIVQVLTVLKNVIRGEGQFDEKNPSIIMCSPDLEEALNMKALHVTEIRWVRDCESEIICNKMLCQGPGAESSDQDPGWRVHCEVLCNNQSTEHIYSSSSRYVYSLVETPEADTVAPLIYQLSMRHHLTCVHSVPSLHHHYHSLWPLHPELWYSPDLESRSDSSVHNTSQTSVQY